MAEKRFISRRITESDKIRTLANNAKYRACFYYTALLAYTDSAGRLNANPLLLKGGMFEGYRETTDEIAETIRDLARVGLVTLYSNGRHQWLIQFAKFHTEQGGFNRPHPKEPESSLAAPEDAGSVVWDDENNTPKRSGKRTGNVRGEVYVEVDVEAEGEHPTDVDDSTSSEARTMHLLTTGNSDSRTAPRARAFFNRLIGADNTKHPQCKDNLTRWYQDYTENELHALWKKARDNPENKARLWYFIDALNGLKPTNTKPIDPGPTPEEVRNFWGDMN